MEKAVSDCLHDILEELTKNELKKFKLKLNKFKLKRDYDNIPMGKLEDASPVDMTQSLLSYYGEDYGAEVTVNVLKSINRRDLAEKLSETLRPVFQLEKDSQHAVNPKAGELRASQSLLNGISSFLSDAVWLVATTWSSSDILNLQQESETPPDPGEEDGLNQRLESEMQQDPEPRQKDDLNWKQESATQRDPELEETDLPKDGVTQGQESQTPQAPKLGVKVGVNQEQKRETQQAPAPGERDGLTLEQESATQQDSEPREREFPTGSASYNVPLTVYNLTLILLTNKTSYYLIYKNLLSVSLLIPLSANPQ
ncbi:pyrin-like isoform X2 [Chrysemys picta bellii]|uniref:pyrin-like isoform X2 n=1 Tax=Chrysemys picta bellii TaxID=8478 RepID=UPI0032B1AB5B